MRTILVPTDFSATAKNAANYALELAKQLRVTKMILYNAYQVPVTVDPAMPVMQLMNMDELKNISESGLHTLRTELVADAEIEIETISEFAVLSMNIEEICTRTSADLIVMGITGTTSNIEEIFIGSNTTSVVKHTHVPVLIVPSHLEYKPVKEILLVCDFKKVAETTPVQPIKKILKDTQAKLLVLNVSSSKSEQSQEVTKEKAILDNLFREFNPEYHFINSNDFTEAVNDFSVKNMVDMVITIPKKHGFFESMFRRSHTKQLAFHTNVPLLCIHD
jgi:nucleotide-binding universal stress UspA family protein